MIFKHSALGSEGKLFFKMNKIYNFNGSQKKFFFPIYIITPA